NNTANGWGALYSNTNGFNNTANGLNALGSNTTGNSNAATGTFALDHNTTASRNTATGYSALSGNTIGTDNTAQGANALLDNTTGSRNVATGSNALYSNQIGGDNTATGVNALYYNTGNPGLAAESNTIRIGSVRAQTNTYIAGISGVTVAGGVGVMVDTNGHLGTVVSSARFKDDIHAMDSASEAILSLQPVTFRYKHELDPANIPQFGLVAEQVEKVNPD